MLRLLRARYGNAVIVDVGDFFSPYVGDQENLQSEFIARAWGGAGYDAVNIGDNEIQTGAPDAFDLARRYAIPIVSVNAGPSNGARDEILPYALINRGGLKIGIVGILDPRLTKGEAGAVSPIRERLGAVLEKLSENADVIIYLAHVRDEETARSLTAAAPVKVKAVIAGHVTPATPRLEEIDGKWLTFARPWNRYVGVLKLTLDNHKNVVTAENEYVPMVKNLAEDGEAAVIIGEYRAKLRELVFAKGLLRRPVQEPPGDVPYAGSAACGTCHGRETDSWKRTAHARAYDTLVAAGREFDPACVRCHVTGYGIRGGFASPADTPDRLGVGCEECHGPGTVHKDAPNAALIGVTQGTCRRCHESGRSPSFDYETYLEKIMHN